MQAWADNLLLTAHKAYAQLDRRRDGSQESCTTTGLHMLQQELGMSRQSAGETTMRLLPHLLRLLQTRVHLHLGSCTSSCMSCSRSWAWRASRLVRLH